MKAILALALIVLLVGCAATGTATGKRGTGHGPAWTDQCAFSYMAFRGQFRCSPIEPSSEQLEIIGILTYEEKKNPSSEKGFCNVQAVISVQRTGSQDWFRRQKLEIDAEDHNLILFGKPGELEIRFNQMWLSCRKI